MLDFMKCVVEAVAANGVKGLLEMVPGGKYAYDIGADALKRHKDKKAQKKLEDDVKEMIAAKADAALAVAKRAVEEAAPQLPPREKELVLQFLTAMPEAARRSLVRKDDQTGTSLPFGFTIHEPEDVVKLLPQRAPRFLPGEWVPGREDNWRLERRLGGGGFGEVWLARHHFKKSEKPRAVKFCTDANARTKLVTHEKQLIVQVMEHAGDHPNIVPLLECHLSGETPWLMYEYVTGGTLADAILDWQKLPPPERLNRVVAVLHTIAGAVGHCHAMSPAIIHRDLKPTNVLMEGGVPRVTDFGIGGTAVDCLITEEKTHAYTSVVGRLPSLLSGSYSLMYSSPQQRDGEKPDPRDDVHALGVIAYQMLVGRLDAEVKGNWQKRLKSDGTPEALIDLIGNSASDDADERPRDVREWEAVITKCAGVACGTPPRQSLWAMLFGSRRPPRPVQTVQPHPKRVPPPAQPLPPPRPAPAPPKPIVRTPGEVVELPLPRGLKMAFCWIPPGTAQLGSPRAEQNAVAERVGSRPDWLATESAAMRGVYTSQGFWLAKYPVTQDEWYAVTRTSPSYFQAGMSAAAKGLDTTRFPVEQVSWDMCQTFLEKLNALKGTEKVFGKAGTFALPHEDMWEYACRGGRGNGQPFYFGKELNGIQANVDGNFPFGTTVKGPSTMRPTRVGAYEAKSPHPWGLCDMHGNVWEWCENLYDGTADRVYRGGSWEYYGLDSRAAHRDGFAPDSREKDVGMRVCLSWVS